MRLSAKKKTSIGVIVVGILLILGGVVWLVLYRGAFGKIQTDLSDRSKEFIDAQRVSSKSEWNSVELGTPVPQAGDLGTRFSTPCFTLSLPFVTRDQKTENKDGSCTFATRVLSPPARLVVWSRPLTHPLAEDTAVTLRRSKKDVYTESKIHSNTVHDVLLFTSEDELILFFASGSTEYSFAFTNVVSSKLTQSDLQAMLDGFTITVAPKKL